MTFDGHDWGTIARRSSSESTRLWVARPKRLLIHTISGAISGSKA